MLASRNPVEPPCLGVSFRRMLQLRSLLPPGFVTLMLLCLGGNTACAEAQRFSVSPARCGRKCVTRSGPRAGGDAAALHHIQAAERAAGGRRVVHRARPVDRETTHRGAGWPRLVRKRFRSPRHVHRRTAGGGGGNCSALAGASVRRPTPRYPRRAVDQPLIELPPCTRRA